MDFLISALGSAGDVHPFIAIAQVLRHRGHDVRLLAPPHFEARVRAAGIAFVPFGAPGDYESLLERAELWEPRRGARFVIDALLDRLPEAYATTVDCIDDPSVVLVGSTLSWGLRLAQETRRLRGATVHLSPTCLPSAFDPPAIAGLGDLSWMPPWLFRGLFGAIERAMLDRWIAPRLNAFRASLGLPPVRRAWSRWMHAPDLVVGAWPAWFAAPQADWPANADASGFPLFDEAGALPPALEDFLASGPPPIGITPGSAMAHGARFIAGATTGAASRGLRAVVVTPYRDQLPSPLPTGVLAVDYAPFSALLPRLAGLVHHGGIGTAAQALAGGLPQVVAPFAHDQFDNAARLVRLGVARTVRPDDGGPRWARAMHAIADPTVVEAASRLRARMRQEPPGAALMADRLVRIGAAEAP